MSYKLSIAIVTRNRPDSLDLTLKSLFEQSEKLYEIIISDDSDNIQLKTNTEILAVKYNCKYISGPQNGLYANRNFVAKHCTGTHIRTMDDDHTFPPNHFQYCLEAIEEDPNIIWTIGEYIIGDTSEHKKPYPTPGQLAPGGFSFTPNTYDEYYGISCGASIYPIAVIEKGILNNEFYKFGLLYLEYGARLRFSGFKLKPLETTYIIHNDAQTSGSQLSKEIVSGAKVYAMLCLSYIYQPTPLNKLKTVAEIVREFAANELNFGAFFKAVKNFRKTRKVVLAIGKSTS